jgi:hypothetical protein
VSCPTPRSSVPRPDTSLIVTTVRSGMLTSTVLSRTISIRAPSPVVIVSCRKTSSLIFNETAAGNATRRALIAVKRRDDAGFQRSWRFRIWRRRALDSEAPCGVWIRGVDLGALDDLRSHRLLGERRSCETQTRRDYER